MKTPVAFILPLAALLTACGSRTDYTATPFFSEAAFRQVRKGMTQSEVRDLVGCPASRFGPVSDSVTGPRTRWEYSVPTSSKPPMRFKSFSVNFGPDGKVIDSLVCEASWEPSDGAEATIDAIRQSRRKLNDLVLIRPDGSTNILRATDPGLHVILLDRDAGTKPRLNPGPPWFVEAMPELFQKGKIAGIEHLYLGHYLSEYQQLIQALAPERARECYRYLDAVAEFKPTVRDHDSLILLYKNGELWSLPGTYSAHAEAAAEDQQWLLHRLAEPSR